MHMTFWEKVAVQRLSGLRAGLVEELNFPPMPAATEENWRKTLDQFRDSNRVFRQSLAKLDPAKAGRVDGCRQAHLLRRRRTALSNIMCITWGRSSLLKKMQA